jgi:phage terminase large subunit GpA-like protein
VRTWEKKPGERNEALDLMVYNLAAAHYVGLHKKTEYQWRVLRDRLQPARQPELFVADVVQTSAPAPDRPLPLDAERATIPAVAVEEHPENRTPQDTAPTPDPAPIRALARQPERLPPKPARSRNFPRRGGWVKHW